MSAFCFHVVSSPYMSTLGEKDKKLFGRVQELEEMEQTNIPVLHCFIVEMVGLKLYIYYVIDITVFFHIHNVFIYR